MNNKLDEALASFSKRSSDLIKECLPSSQEIKKAIESHCNPYILESKDQINQLVFSRSVEFAKFNHVKNDFNALLSMREDELEASKAIAELNYESLKLYNMDDLNCYINGNHILSELSHLLDKGLNVKCDRGTINSFGKNAVIHKIKQRAYDYKFRIYEYLISLLITSGGENPSALLLSLKKLEQYCLEDRVPNITAHLTMQMIKDDITLYNNLSNTIELLPIYPITTLTAPDYQGYIAAIVFAKSGVIRKKYEYLISKTSLLEDLFKYSRYIGINAQEVSDLYMKLRNRYTLNTNSAIKNKFIFNKLFTKDKTETTFSEKTALNIAENAFNKAYSAIRNPESTFHDVKKALTILFDLKQHDYIETKTLFSRHQEALDRRLIISIERDMMITKGKGLPKSLKVDFFESHIPPRQFD